MTSEQATPFSNSIPSSMQQTATQAYQIRFKNWKCTIVHMTSANASESAVPEYIVESHLRKPNLVFKSPANGSIEIDNAPTIAETRWHSFSTKIEVQVNGTTLQLAPKSWWRGKEYNLSSAVANQTLTWRSHTSWKQQSWICLDEKAMPLAKASLNSWKWKDIGSFEFESELSQSLREELIATGMTMLFWTMMQNSSAASASAASG